MFIYVSEYYVGIAEQRKLDLAAKRISKVIKLTKEVLYIIGAISYVIRTMLWERNITKLLKPSRRDSKELRKF